MSPDASASERQAAFERGYVRGWREAPRMKIGAELWLSKSHAGQERERSEDRVYWRGGYRQGALDRKTQESERKLLTLATP